MTGEIKNKKFYYYKLKPFYFNELVNSILVSPKHWDPELMSLRYDFAHIFSVTYSNFYGLPYKIEVIVTIPVQIPTPEKKIPFLNVRLESLIFRINFLKPWGFFIL